jgi:hypothetical protein
MSPERNMVPGERVEVRLHGDSNWYAGTVADRPRKMWVDLDENPFGRDYVFTADEGCIAEWRQLTTRNKRLDSRKSQQ